MAKQRPGPAPQLDRGGEDFSPAGGVTAADLPLDGPAADDPRDAEIERLRAELAAATAGPAFAAGGRFLVKLRDAPSWVVEPEPGEHPFEAYKRATGVLASAYAPEIHPTEAPAGRAA